MNRLVIIGNGFDMAHGLKTSYKDFINWYWDQRVDQFVGINTNVSHDILCTLSINKNDNFNSWFAFYSENSGFKDIITHKRRNSGLEIYEFIKSNSNLFDVQCSPFLEKVLQSIESKGWVDIENDYYQLLKKCIDDPNCGFTIKELNDQLSFLKDKLVEYLKTIKIANGIDNLHEAIVNYLNPADFSTIDRKKAVDNLGLDIKNIEEVSNPEDKRKLIPERIMLLSFNYTHTAQLYGNFNLTLNYIHGDLNHPKNIIFGYGDELDKDFQDILEMNDNELLSNVKSVKYLETGNYRKLLEFIQVVPFQVLIMGHSCGNSDRTLLNTIFEHENCVSIKPFYHKNPADGSDNYLEIVQNIYRDFTDKKLFRARVVNKDQCQTI